MFTAGEIRSRWLIPARCDHQTCKFVKIQASLVPSVKTPKQGRNLNRTHTISKNFALSARTPSSSEAGGASIEQNPLSFPFPEFQCTKKGPGDGRPITHNVVIVFVAKSLCLGLARANNDTNHAEHNSNRDKNANDGCCLTLSTLCTISVMLVVATRFRATQS